jgi:hypothetical protein
MIVETEQIVSPTDRVGCIESARHVSVMPNTVGLGIDQPKREAPRAHGFDLEDCAGSLL